MRTRQLGVLGLISLAAAALLAVALSDATAWGDCDNYNHGCRYNTVVPCSNAYCAGLADYPAGQDSPDRCPDTSLITLWSATSALNWKKCRQDLTQDVHSPYLPYIYGACLNNNTKVCANVWYFAGTPCTEAHKCATGFPTGCGDAGGPDCSP